jgi:uncharacterized membrane protein YcaP (DUF421 family)
MDMTKLGVLIIVVCAIIFIGSIVGIVMLNETLPHLNSLWAFLIVISLIIGGVFGFFVRNSKKQE